MKLSRIIVEKGDIHYVEYLGNKKALLLSGSPYSNTLQYTDKNNVISIHSSRLLPPCIPTKIVAIAANYIGATGVTESMAEPLVFIKSPNTITLSHHPIPLPFECPTWGEAELAFVMKKTARHVKNAQSGDYILGYLMSNDLTCQNIENRDHHLARSKSADGFCPIGDFIDTDFLPQNQRVEAFQNNRLIRKGSLGQMIWSPYQIIEEISKWMTLEPGDIILTGTPPRVREREFLNEGDLFKVKIEGLGEMENRFYVECIK